MLDDRYYLRKCIEISENSVKNGNTPFGALLADKEGNILLEQENIELTTHSCTGHAETSLASKASKSYSKDFLKDCTLYSSIEPCAIVFRGYLLEQYRKTGLWSFRREVIGGNRK